MSSTVTQPQKLISRNHAKPDTTGKTPKYKDYDKTSLCSSITVSTCAVLGNMSTAVAVWAL